MSDTDSLDGLIDDIDMDALLEPKKEETQHTLKKTETGTVMSSEVDLDDMLDDFFGGDDVKSGGGKETKGITALVDDDDIDDMDSGGLTAHLRLQRTNELKEALRTVPDANLKQKWMNILSQDIDSKYDSSDSLRRSYTYMEWQDPVEHFSVDKSLRNNILRASSKSGITDDQAKRLQDKLFADPVLLKKYCKQIISDKKIEVKSCQDYNEESYPSLTVAMT